MQDLVFLFLSSNESCVNYEGREPKTNRVAHECLDSIAQTYRRRVCFIFNKSYRFLRYGSTALIITSLSIWVATTKEFIVLPSRHPWITRML